jgi:mannose-6-phosphate isomerase
MGTGRIYRLRNTIQAYAWGARGAIAALQGRPPSDTPEAELWLGAHPKAPSRVMTSLGETPLDAWIAEDPEAALGSAVAERYGELPFLLKVLAAEQPLSIQAHPDAAQAEAGFARENAAGLPLDAPERSYRDARPKPELICALTPFLALNRFRAPRAIADRLEPLAGPELGEGVRALLDAPPKPALAHFFEALLRLEAEPRSRVLERALAHAREDAEFDAASEWVVRLAALYPGDAGVLAPWILNLVELRPGDAMYLDAGELHAYLDGVGIECMASSDNVLRGGLTQKHMDVDELLHVLHFESGDVEILRPEPISSVEGLYATPAPDFALSRLDLEEATPFRAEPRNGPEILLCVEGACRVGWDGSEPLAIERGESVFVPGNAPAYEVGGTGALYRARVGPARARSAGAPSLKTESR